MRLSLEDCDVEKDITAFIKDCGTGQEIPDPPKFINFCRGDAETSSQVSEDENYSVAQFARTMNPTYRTSSPQPSMFESHHDPNNPLAKELGLQHDTQPIAPEAIDVLPQQPIPQDQMAVQPRHAPSRQQSREPPVQQSREPPQRLTRELQQPAREPPAQHAREPMQHTREPLQHTREPPQHTREPPQHTREPPQQAREPQQQVMREPSQQLTREPPQQLTREPPQQLTREPPQQLTREPPQQLMREPPQQLMREPPQQLMREPPQTQRAPQPDPRLVQAQQQARQNYQQSQVPHNDYPTDGMTQFCRIGPPSDRSTIPSPARPSSRDSQSEYSNPTSFSSMEPPSGSASPGKPMPQSSFPEPSPLEDTSTQKKRGFFNSPFARRKSKHEKEPPTITPSNRNTWGPVSRRTDENISPTKPLARVNRGTMVHDAPRSTSPEPVDPRANFQLNVGNNVFDVASPDKKKQPKAQEQQEDLDPIAQALEELKGVTKQTSLRVSADRYHGLATPQPPATPAIGANLPGGAPTPLANVSMNAAKRGTPPPSYEQPPPMSRLGAPKPAHTARQMQKTTQMYVNQKTNMFSEGSRPSSRSPTKQEAPRAASPAPPRATSPRPGMYTQTSQQPAPNSYRGAPQQQASSPSSYRPQQQQQQPSASTNSYRTASPNHYAAPPAASRSRAGTTTAPAQAYGTPVGRNSYSSARGGSPSVNTMPRAASPQPPPQPTYAQPQSRPASRAAPISRAASPQPQFRQQSFDRPSSSRGSEKALSIAPAPSERGEGSVYGGSQRGRGTARPQSSYHGGSGGSEFNFNGGGGGGGGSSVRAESRVRSKSLAEPKNYNRDGRIILNYCKSQATALRKIDTNRFTARAMYSYAAQIPEELAFQKGDILAVLRLQDDGWWEAEAVGKNGRPGLVPSNYLQAC
jgi:hypothetical protein